MELSTFYLIDIGFLEFGIWDILDIVIVAYLIYRIYKLLRGSIAFSIFAGLLMLYVIWWIVNALHMQLLSTILSQFVSVGVILLIILFQPEIRTFLLDLGRTAFGNRLDPLRKWLNLQPEELAQQKSVADKILSTVRTLRNEAMDGIIVLSSGMQRSLEYSGGVQLDIDYNEALVNSLLRPESKFRNGAVVIEDGKLRAVGARFPYSDTENLPEKAGMKHRLGLGVTEIADAGAIIVSGEDGSVSTAYQGYLAYGVNDSEIERFVHAHAE